jgi:hypothetical protein
MRPDVEHLRILTRHAYHTMEIPFTSVPICMSRYPIIVSFFFTSTLCQFQLTFYVLQLVDEFRRRFTPANFDWSKAAGDDQPHAILRWQSEVLGKKSKRLAISFVHVSFCAIFIFRNCN